MVQVENCSSETKPVGVWPGPTFDVSASDSGGKIVDTSRATVEFSPSVGLASRNS